ncbi:hypothetical protein TI05_03555 [Achromatium sp. WMS3]|nr:hypothetical protein TI05_03555 [Achromatium sp. WMS3]
MNAVSKYQLISPEAYLLSENDSTSGVKYEYVDGQVYAMAGASREHNIIAGNFFLSLGTHLKGSPCRVFQSDMKVGIRSLKKEHFYYPDIQVSCIKEKDRYYNTSPCLIVEVLSDNTARIDRHEKFIIYKTLPSLQEYILCSQNIPLVELYRRRTAWNAESYQLGQTFTVESIELEINVDTLYDYD